MTNCPSSIAVLYTSSCLVYAITSIPLLKLAMEKSQIMEIFYSYSNLKCTTKRTSSYQNFKCVKSQRECSFELLCTQ